MNKWEEDATKLNWRKVRLTGWAQTAFQRFPEYNYSEVNVLKDRFKPQICTALSPSFIGGKKMSHGLPSQVA